MGRRKRLSEYEKGQIDALFKEKKSIRGIAKQLKRSDHVVRNYLKNPAQYGKKNNGGRPKKLSARDERQIVNTASNSMISVRTIQREQFPDDSKNTIWRALKSSPNIKRAKMIKAPMLKPEHKVARFNFAVKHMNKVNWKKVNFVPFIISYIKNV